MSPPIHDDEPVERLAVMLTVNGQRQEIDVPSDASLLDVLRDQLALTGTKRACDRGACGACTVLLDGLRVNACLTLAASIDGAAVTTVEGLVDANGAPSALQQAFVACDGLQCGFCTPGQLMSATGLIAECEAAWSSRAVVGPQGDSPVRISAGSRASIAESMSGNLCRCGAYPNIVDAILSVMTRGARS